MEFDAIVIGAGQAGPPLSGRLTGAGMKVALVERALFGGTCVNTGCMPTKALVASAYAAQLARRAAEYGVVIAGEVRVDITRVKARSDRIVARARQNIEEWLLGMAGCTVFRGQARFDGPKAVRVGDERLSAPRIFINVGGRAVVPEMPGVRDVPFLTNSSILELGELPEHLLIVGGSYVGLEFAQIYRRLGSKVTVVERAARLIPREDAEISDAVRAILAAEGIVARTGAECIRLARHEGGVAPAHTCCWPSVAGRTRTTWASSVRASRRTRRATSPWTSA
jgi:pyruvate/2-oxoglutarate dehydrogenase complex dihydrolipoamide dehydrogenase (E3) component